MPASDSPSEYSAVINMLQEIHANQLRFAENMVHRGQCDAAMSELFDRIEKEFVRLPSLTRAECTVLDRARDEDEKMWNKMDKIENDIRKINDKLVIFNFSRCTLVWIWNNKKGVTALFALLSLWQFVIGWISRLAVQT